VNPSQKAFLFLQESFTLIPAELLVAACFDFFVPQIRRTALGIIKNKL